MYSISLSTSYVDGAAIAAVINQPGIAGPRNSRQCRRVSSNQDPSTPRTAPLDRSRISQESVRLMYTSRLPQSRSAHLSCTDCAYPETCTRGLPSFRSLKTPYTALTPRVLSTYHLTTATSAVDWMYYDP